MLSVYLFICLLIYLLRTWLENHVKVNTITTNPAEGFSLIVFFLIVENIKMKRIHLPDGGTRASQPPEGAVTA